VEHTVDSNKSDIIDLGLWWCRRTDVATRRLACPSLAGAEGGPVKVGQRPPEGATLTGPVTCHLENVVGVSSA
jgi:hypothetical protein